MTYFEKMFAPMPGYHPSFVLLTTYTYDPGLTAELILRYALYDKEIAGVSQVQSRMLLKEQFNENRVPPVAILTHEFSGAQKAPGFPSNHNSSGLFRFLNKHLHQVVFPVPMNGGIFHPKIVLVEFQSNEDLDGGKEKLYRLLVSSKNLVSDGYHQFGLVLSGEPGEKNHNLNLLSQLRIPEFVKQKLAVLEHIRFAPEETPAGMSFDACEVLVGGPASHLWERFSQDVTDADSLSVYTDSLSDDFMKKLPRKPDLLVSNPVRWRNFMAPNSEIPGYAHVPEKVYLHGKLFAAQKKDKHILWVGSANATPQGYSSNVEAMVRLEWSSPDKLSQHLNALVQLPAVRQLSAGDLVETVQDRMQQWAKELQVAVSALDEHRLTLTISQTKSDPDQIRAQLLGQSSTVAADRTEIGYIAELPLTPGCLSQKPAVIICGYMEREWYQVICSLKLEQENWQTLWQSAWEAQLNISDGVLLEHMLPSLRDVIPPQKSGQPQYSSLDTPQQRLAKYLDSSQPLGAQYQQVAANLCELDTVIRLQLNQTVLVGEDEIGRFLLQEDMLKKWDWQYRQAMQFLKEVQDVVRE